MTSLSDKQMIIAYHDSAADTGRMDAWQARLQPYLPGITLVPLSSEAAEGAGTVFGTTFGTLARLSQLKVWYHWSGC